MLVLALLVAVTFVSYVAEDHGMRAVAAAYVIPVVVAIQFWGLKRAVPVLVLVPVANEFVSLATNWSNSHDLTSDPELASHLVGSAAVILIGIAYAGALNTRRSLQRELTLRRDAEARESVRASRQSILANISREIGSIEDSIRVKSQIVSSMSQIALPDSLRLFERIDHVAAWVDSTRSGEPADDASDHLAVGTVPFEKLTELELLESPTWVSDQIAVATRGTQATSADVAARTLIIPILWRTRMIAFAALDYVENPEPDEEQIELLQQATFQIAGSLAGNQVYADAVRLADRLDREGTAKDRMIAVVSHEMNTPLTAAVVMSDVLLRNSDNNLSNRQLEQLRVIRRNLQRIIGVSDDLLESSRMRAGSFELHTEPTDLAQLVADSVESFRPIAGGRDQEIEYKRPEGAVSVITDPARLSQSVINLLGNASKFSKQGQALMVRVGSNPSTARVEIEDHGPGISPEELEHVFDWAFQAEVEAENEQSNGKNSSGIGLFVARAIVTAHGGKIGIDSTLGEQTTAWFEIPVGLAAPAA